eukprot:340577-Rhodomonas_salina.2
MLFRASPRPSPMLFRGPNSVERCHPSSVGTSRGVGVPPPRGVELEPLRCSSPSSPSVVRIAGDVFHKCCESDRCSAPSPHPPTNNTHIHTHTIN